MPDREAQHRRVIDQMAREIHDTKRRNGKPTTLEGERAAMREVAKRHDQREGGRR